MFLRLILILVFWHLCLIACDRSNLSQHSSQGQSKRRPRLGELEELAVGYDEEDSFIDNTEAVSVILSLTSEKQIRRSVCVILLFFCNYPPLSVRVCSSKKRCPKTSLPSSEVSTSTKGRSNRKRTTTCSGFIARSPRTLSRRNRRTKKSRMTAAWKSRPAVKPRRLAPHANGRRSPRRLTSPTKSGPRRRGRRRRPRKRRNPSIVTTNRPKTVIPVSAPNWPWS